MNTVPFRAVLEDVLGLAGYPYDTASQLQLDQAARFINRRVREAWEWGPWPEWTPTEQRAFADPFDITNTYGAGEIVYDETTDAYYECLQELTSGIQVSNGSYWEAVTSYDPVIAWEQRGQEKIGRVWSVTKYDPFTKGLGSNYSFGFYSSPEGIEVLDCTLKRVWLLYSLRYPQYSAKPHAAGQVYRYGDVVYYPGTEDSDLFPDRGECYKASLDVEGNEVWEWVKFPALLQSYVTSAAGADMLRHYGQKQLAVDYEARALDYLKAEFDKLNLGALINARGVL